MRDGVEDAVSPPQRRRRLVPLGDVAHMYQDSDLAPVFAKARRQLDRNHLSVPGETLAFQDRGLRCEQARETVADRLLALGRNQIGDVLAQECFAGQAMQSCGGGVGVQHDAGLRLHKDGIG